MRVQVYGFNLDKPDIRYSLTCNLTASRLQNQPYIFITNSTWHFVMYDKIYEFFITFACKKHAGTSARGQLDPSQEREASGVDAWQSIHLLDFFGSVLVMIRKYRNHAF